MREIFQQIKGRLVVSCQAEGDSPFNSPEGVAMFAKCAVMGGAAAIRTCGVEKSDYLVRHIDLPIIALTKSYFEDGFVRITGSMAEVEQLMAVGADVIAIDGTLRHREGLSGPEFIRKVKTIHPDVVVMADIATLEEARACREAGADCVSTTLCGYTPETVAESKSGPSLELLRKIVKEMPDYPVISEGRYNTPAEAAEGIKAGAWAVVVGSAITRPHLITEWFVKAVTEAKQD